MAYLNNEYSLDYSLEQPQESGESEIQFLKIKLIETHAKFIKELEYSKGLESQLEEGRRKQDGFARDNQDLSKRFAHHSQQQDRLSHDKLKQLEITLVDSEKKNDLLRLDLESMRTKTLELVAVNQHLEQQNTEYERSHSKLTDKLNALVQENKTKSMMLEEHKQEADRYRAKYEKQIANNREAELELEELKRYRANISRRYEDLETSLRIEKEKQGKQFNQVLLVQKEAKEWKAKAESLHDETSKAKDQLYQLRSHNKTEERNFNAELERLTQDYNHLQGQFRQKEHELSSARKRPIETATRKKKTFDETKELVVKLQREEQHFLVSRSSPTREGLSPGRGTSIRAYKQQKQEYMSIIQSVGSMESQMLACNLQKKRIHSEMDKIDQTRVKTKDMIARRRRLEVEQQNNERHLEQVRSELKKMKVM